MTNVKRALAIAGVIALSSELYFNVFVNSFRISPAVILFPILLMTIGKQLRVMPVALSTSLCIYIFRTLILAVTGTNGASLWEMNIPAACFYVCYGFVFRALVQDRYGASPANIAWVAFAADLLSNFTEVMLREATQGNAYSDFNVFTRLAIVALFRSLLVFLGMVCARWYSALLKTEEHERRYRRLFMLSTGLKSEVYLMRRNSEQIERVMGNAYRLYEELQKRGLPDDMQRMGLEIAREVHEVKKDYLRIITGLEKEISIDPASPDMSFMDLIAILEDTMHNAILKKNVDIQIITNISYPFRLTEHYSMMSILNNLVNNAIEAIEGDKKKGTIWINEKEIGKDIVIRVRDNGPGISERHLQNIFRMGYSTKFDEKTGSIFRGVGLNGVQNIVEDQFGGVITVVSTVGEGTEFTVMIPKDNLEKGGHRMTEAVLAEPRNYASAENRNSAGDVKEE